MCLGRIEVKKASHTERCGRLFFAGKVKQPQQFLLGSNVVAYEKEKNWKECHKIIEEINMSGYIRKNSKQKRHPTISWTPFYNYKSLIESLYNSNHNAIEIL